MKDLLKLAAVLLVILAIIVGHFWWTAYKYNDCRAVGHSKLYCIAKHIL